MTADIFYQSVHWAKGTIVKGYQENVTNLYEVGLPNIGKREGTYFNRGIAKRELGDLNGACADWKEAGWVLYDCN